MNSKLNVISDKPKAPEVPRAPYAGNALMVTLGCAKNLVDSEVMLGALRAKGFELVTKPDQADLIVVNTCAFLESAVEEGIDRILEMAAYKKSARCKQLVVAGCMVERYRDDLEKSLPEVDRFISTDDLLLVGDTGSQSILDKARRPYFLYDEGMPRVLSTSSHLAYVKIAEGCDRPCTFCIIPKIRGEFRSRPIESILEEVRLLKNSGTKEFNLVAQDLTAYGNDRSRNNQGKELVKLLSSIESIVTEEEKIWLRLLYAYPIGVNDDLLALIADSKVVCPYLDLPLQHVSDSVLKSMQRPLGGKKTKELIEKISKHNPKIAFRTTFLVGFPGETEQDFRELESFVSEGHFTHLGVFAYSQEKEAVSFSFDNQVPEEERAERRERIMLAQQGVVNKFLKSKVGQEEIVLVDGVKENQIIARANWQAPETDNCVIIDKIETGKLSQESNGLKGKFVKVKYNSHSDYDLFAELSDQNV